MKFFLKISLLLTILVVNSQSVLIICNFRLIYDVYTCDLSGLEDNQVMYSRDNDREIVVLQGNHMRARINDDVKRVYSDDQFFDQFPRGFTKFLKNIVAIELRRAMLPAIAKEDLQEFGGKLKYLNLHLNKIKVIEADLFVYNENLEEIILALNLIVRIGSGAFDGLTKLRVIDFSGNRCVPDDMNFRDNVTQLIPKLEEKCKG